MPKLIVLSAGKSGTGRSTTCRALLVSAGLAGLNAVAVDTDPQNTISKWGQRRERAVAEYPDAFLPARIVASPIKQVMAEIRRHRDCDLILVDTPPNVEDALPANIELLRRADLIIVPTSTSSDDLDSVIPWLSSLTNELKLKPQVLLNRVNRRARAFEPARNRLKEVATVLPSEVPLYEDIQVAHASGLTCLDLKDAKGVDAFHGLWLHTRQMLSL